jgi:hypothetical protein
MSLIDVAIPAIIGTAALLWPKMMFLGSRATLNERKIKWVRYAGGLLLLVAIFDLLTRIVGH